MERLCKKRKEVKEKGKKRKSTEQTGYFQNSLWLHLINEVHYPKHAYTGFGERDNNFMRINKALGREPD